MLRSPVNASQSVVKRLVSYLDVFGKQFDSFGSALEGRQLPVDDAHARLNIIQRSGRQI